MVSNITYVGRNVAFGEVRWMHRLLSDDVWCLATAKIITGPAEQEQGWFRFIETNVWGGGGMFWNNIFVSLSAGFSDITSFLKLGSENVSLKIAKLFLPPSGPQRLKSQRWKQPTSRKKQQKNIQYLNVRVEMHSKELQK